VAHSRNSFGFPERQENTSTLSPHGQYWSADEPFDKWVKPVDRACRARAIIRNAHLFPLAYKLKNLGLLVGMPVPGTGTFVCGKTRSILLSGSESYGLCADAGRKSAARISPNLNIRVPNEPDIMAGGRDQQIEAAVRNY